MPDIDRLIANIIAARDELQAEIDTKLDQHAALARVIEELRLTAPVGPHRCPRGDCSRLFEGVRL